MSDNYREYPWSRKGDAYDEMFSEVPFEEEEEFDLKEADQRITQFVTSADELSGPPVEELADQVAALMRSTAQPRSDHGGEAPQQGTRHTTVARPASSQIAAARPRTVAAPRSVLAT